MLAFCLQSELETKVLIVDARLKLPFEGVTGRLGFQNAPGFADVLRVGFKGSNGLIRATPIANVSFLPAGLTWQGSPAVIDRPRLSELFDALRNEFDFVLVQLGSVLADTRTLITAEEANTVFIVAEENRTYLKSLDECFRVLVNHGVRDVRTVVTGSPG
jgi:MinD-like ATPase involved in chromosome partitioning or flagellar assembly